MGALAGEGSQASTAAPLAQRVLLVLVLALVLISVYRQQQKRENDVHLRQLAKQIRTYFFSSAFLGVSRQGEFENTRKNWVRFKKNDRGSIFSGGEFFLGDFF
jgi:hypothetical protein